MKVDYQTALEIASHEAVIRQAYKDSVGVWTWSVGLTNASGHKVERYIDNPQPLQHCLGVYVWALENYAEAVNAEFQDCPLTREEFTAALSFHWNTGAIKSASWVDYFKDGQKSKARDSFMQWRKPKEIIPRRKKEAELLFEGKWSNNGTMTEYTRLTSNYTPVWSSAESINVEEELGSLLNPKEETQSSEAEEVLYRIRELIDGFIR